MAHEGVRVPSIASHAFIMYITSATLRQRHTRPLSPSSETLDAQNPSCHRQPSTAIDSHRTLLPTRRDDASSSTSVKSPP